MKTRANSRVSVLRGTKIDSFGDSISDDVVVVEGVTASIVEQNQTARTASDDAPRQVRYITGRVPAGIDVRPGDRLRDDATSETYLVDNVTQPKGLVRTNDLRLALRRVT